MQSATEIKHVSHRHTHASMDADYVNVSIEMLKKLNVAEPREITVVTTRLPAEFLGYPQQVLSVCARACVYTDRWTDGQTDRQGFSNKEGLPNPAHSPSPATEAECGNA